MSNTIQINREVPKVTANLVPMHIQYSGPAKTNDYFTPSKTKEVITDKEVEVAYFRGCKLAGEKLELDGNFTGYILNKSETLARVEGMADDGYGNNIVTVNTYTPTAQFDDIILYGHDVPEGKNNQYSLINEFKNINDILHSD
ncbi:ribonuclease H2, subunit C [Scheffersomyces xylosifermentans]|uniref:ribonuclease H2, subunit C n=1 Tax=Scheffersomyces xylosifermentans TaxID=1304137 RepID=UPI00315C7DCE